ncbi:MAG: site-specific integrase [Hoeflea sp.]|uniref:site-specific integrase n=1 Tax=Hoeflea sp. TaxID=1940281 RepID=UPI002730C3A0|nr:site-specific integrase [Hoeflea sp.]MDP2118538.1 site-specific integrase [Hoeflea sp.]
MAIAQHVFKRGAVYWWRRRLPNGMNSRALVPLEMSLRTKSLEQAKTIAAEVTLASERLLSSLRRKMISPDDAKRILIHVATEHGFHLDAMNAASRHSSVDVEHQRQKEIQTGWAFRLFAAQGVEAKVGPNEEREMQSAGLDDQSILEVSRTVEFLREAGFAAPGRTKIETILKHHNISSSDMHIRQAESIYLRAMAANLLNTERRWSGVRPDDIATLQEAFRQGPQPSHPISDQVQSPHPMPAVLPSAQGAPVHPNGINGTTCASSPLEEHDGDFELDDDIEDDAERASEESGRSLVEIVNQTAAEKVSTGEWKYNMVRQHAAIANMIVRFVGHDQPSRLRQSDIANFRSALFKLPKSHGKSPKDYLMPFSELIARAETLPPDKVGLSNSTLNRYMTQINNIVSICKHAGYPFGDFEGVAGLRIKKKGDARDERGRFSTDEVTQIFHLPVWCGAVSAKDRFQRGNTVFHDATYWVPLLAIYNGARREENCGLLLADIEVDAEMACINIRPNSVRGLKSVQSKRRLPIHPELIRLGFLDYVEELRKLGHSLLFPELKAASTSTTMGDVFDGSWQKIRSAALPNAMEEAKVFHSLRHWCNNEMKQAGVQAEIRKDLLGHTNGGVNEGRYTDIARLRVMADALDTLPHPTGHLIVHPINLIEPVLTHASRPGRAKKRVLTR